MPFKTIYQAALTRDISQLHHAVGQGCIDEWKVGRFYFSAATQLAFENNQDAVSFLTNHGSSVHYAAIGAGMANNQAYAGRLIAMGANKRWVALGAGIGGHQVYADSLITMRNDMHWIALGAGIGGHQFYADTLIDRGSEKRWAALGAGIGGHQNYASALIARGTPINAVAKGAGIGGHHAYAEALIAGRALLNRQELANGAAQGGHRDYVETLIARGIPLDLSWLAESSAEGGHLFYLNRKLDFVARGAAQGGHLAYVQTLLAQGANMHYVAWGVVIGNYIDGPSPLMYLLNFNPSTIKSLSSALSCYEEKYGIMIDENMVNKAIAMSAMMREYALNYVQALANTNGDCRVLLRTSLSLLLYVRMPTNTNKWQALPADLWPVIASFLTPLPLKPKEWQQLNFLLGRKVLCHALTNYSLKWFASHANRAIGFLTAAEYCQDKNELQKLVKEQVKLVQGGNPDPSCERNQLYQHDVSNQVMDSFHRHLFFIHQRLNGETVSLIKEKSHLSKCSFM